MSDALDPLELCCTLSRRRTTPNLLVGYLAEALQPRAEINYLRQLQADIHARTTSRDLRQV